MYYIGIDISKFKHDCAVIDDSGEIVTPSWSFTNDSEGLSQLKTLVDSLDAETRIGLESTGHYGMNLKLFLESNNFSFMEFNPLLITSFINNYNPCIVTRTDSGKNFIALLYFIKFNLNILLAGPFVYRTCIISDIFISAGNRSRIFIRRSAYNDV